MLFALWHLSRNIGAFSGKRFALSEKRPASVRKNWLKKLTCILFM